MLVGRVDWPAPLRTAGFRRALWGFFAEVGVGKVLISRKIIRIYEEVGVVLFDDGQGGEHVVVDGFFRGGGLLGGHCVAFVAFGGGFVVGLVVGLVVVFWEVVEVEVWVVVGVLFEEGFKDSWVEEHVGEAVGDFVS